MNILAFDTSADFLNIALKTKNSFYEVNHRIGLKHSEHLLPEVEHLLSSARLKASELDLIVCTRGPGSFTGLRIGFATAKGLSQGADVPLVSISTLDLYAEDAVLAHAVTVPVIDARKKRFYAAVYCDGKSITEELDIASVDLAAQLDPEVPVVLTGPDAPLFLKELGETRLDVSIDPGCLRGHGRSLIALGLARFKEAGVDPDGQGPVYLRKSEAEIARDNGLID